ncbi:hypothetical protein BDN70DRAFT_926290 [Pholiota conissans]|uniref:F-box domain-containing protein n=1 Tax=Pholiota conissans TaxID=109636 RepID=A0A9P5YLD3_9AGAR|nr:hypothetical protein BDN70DRAFT_926290 [Pholiota conissans]
MKQTAPMLFCHVCSSWRRVALESAILWSYLSFQVSVYETNPRFASWALLKDEIDLLRWWKTNHRAIPPMMRISLSIVYLKRHYVPKDLVAGDSVDFLLEYISTLYLPALQTLSLPLDTETWNNCHTQELSTVLHSTPNLTTLTLGLQFFDLMNDGRLAIASHYSNPFWSVHSLDLKHLRIEIPPLTGDSH